MVIITDMLVCNNEYLVTNLVTIVQGNCLNKVRFVFLKVVFSGNSF